VDNNNQYDNEFEDDDSASPAYLFTSTHSVRTPPLADTSTPTAPQDGAQRYKERAMEALHKRPEGEVKNEIKARSGKWIQKYELSECLTDLVYAPWFVSDLKMFYGKGQYVCFYPLPLTYQCLISQACTIYRLVHFLLI
jgi:hypothetical protein